VGHIKQYLLYKFHEYIDNKLIARIVFQGSQEIHNKNIFDLQIY